MNQKTVAALFDVSVKTVNEHLGNIFHPENCFGRLNGFPELTGRDILKGTGSIPAEDAKAYALGEYKKHRVIQDKLYQSDFDKSAEYAKGEQK